MSQNWKIYNCIPWVHAVQHRKIIVCSMLSFLFLTVVNEMDRGLDLFSCLYLISFVQLFSWTLAITSQSLERSYKIECICPVYLSSCLGVFFLFYHYFFSKFSDMKFIVAEPDFPEEWWMVRKLWKWTKNGSKQVFLEFIERIGHEFLLSLYYLVCSCINPIFEQI